MLLNKIKPLVLDGTIILWTVADPFPTFGALLPRRAFIAVKGGMVFTVISSYVWVTLKAPFLFANSTLAIENEIKKRKPIAAVSLNKRMKDVRYFLGARYFNASIHVALFANVK